MYQYLVTCLQFEIRKTFYAFVCINKDLKKNTSKVKTFYFDIVLLLLLLPHGDFFVTLGVQIDYKNIYGTHACWAIYMYVGRAYLSGPRQKTALSNTPEVLGLSIPIK